LGEAAGGEPAVARSVDFEVADVRDAGDAGFDLEDLAVLRVI
jgi:hypothetical protein